MCRYRSVAVVYACGSSAGRLVARALLTVCAWVFHGVMYTVQALQCLPKSPVLSRHRRHCAVDTSLTCEALRERAVCRLQHSARFCVCRTNPSTGSVSLAAFKRRSVDFTHDKLHDLVPCDLFRVRRCSRGRRCAFRTWSGWKSAGRRQAGIASTKTARIP